MRASLLIAAAFLVHAPGPAAAPVPGEPRVALVIGNGAYKDSPLVNPVNDARAVGAALRDAGFDVIELHDSGAVEMRRAIRDFGERLRGKGAGLFYFAGHGVQVRGRNFLVPVNADIKYEDEVEDQSVEVSLVLGKMESAKARVNLVILDACRNNPYARTARSAQNGLAPMEAPIGSLIAFATSPGQVASDGLGSNGLYTLHLVREIAQPGLKVEDVFKRVRAAVRSASQGRQVPWENTSLEGDFYFHMAPAVDSAALERERLRREEERIQGAVAAALTRSRDEAEREKKRLEQFYAEKLEAERASIRKEALERIAAIESAARAAAKPEVVALAAPQKAEPAPAQVPAPAPARIEPSRIEPPSPRIEPRAEAAPAKADPAPSKPEVPPSAPEAAAAKAESAPEPVTTEAGAEPGETQGEVDPAARLLAMVYGFDASRLNKVASVSEEVARAARPAPQVVGDRRIYQREIRDGQGVTRRNYVTTTVAFADAGGFTVAYSDSEIPGRFDGQGNRFSFPYVPGHVSGAVVFDPVDSLYRFPLAPGAVFSTKHNELSRGNTVSADGRVTVVGWEDVEVPAGKYRAMKLTKVAERSWEPFPGQRTVTKQVSNYWYVPGLRGIAKFEGLEATSRGEVIFDQTWELDTFELNPAP